MENRWVIKERGEERKVKELAEELGISERLSNLLVQRGIDSFEKAKQFFRPQLSDLHDPFLMKDLEKAVERIERALEENERILIYGDYDVDGTTSVSLLYSFFSHFYDNLDYYIPDRYTEGYGISLAGIDYAEETGVSLIIALDCGVKALEQIDYANEKGIDFIICDHHRPGETLPKAYALLDPKRDDCEYPYKELSGCGVGFKLLQGFCEKFPEYSDHLFDHLDLVSVSIACDIVPITGENRILCYYGLKNINENPGLGLKTMVENANKEGQLNVTDLVFTIGPRINAAGRIEHGKKAVQLLTSPDKLSAEEMTQLINNHNEERRGLDKEITEEALSMLSQDLAYADRRSTVVYQPHWHKGVVGIVASRLIETHYKPTVVLTESNGKLTGSARSVKGFDVYNAIDACSDLLEQFGGHMYAAGLTLKPENFEAFVDQFEHFVAKNITEHQLYPEIEIDEEINFDEITSKFYRILSQLEPYGPENMKPIFLTKGVQNDKWTKTVGSDNSHLKLHVKQNGVSIDGIAFGMGNYYDKIVSGEPFDIVYTIEENRWKDRVNLQLMVKDIKFQ